MDDDHLKLYLRMAKNFTFNLPNEKDRIIASKWIKKIEETTEVSAKKTKMHVIQLLLMCLQRKILVGNFEKPPLDKTLMNYKWTHQPHDISRLILRKEFENYGKPEVKVEVSGDLCEFIAYQDIPNFGSHFFYAFSPEEIKKWNNLDKGIIPKGLLNITVIPSPEISMLQRSVEENRNRKLEQEQAAEEAIKGMEGNEIDLEGKPIGQFVDVTILDSYGKIKTGFLNEQNQAKNLIDTNLMQTALKANIINPNDFHMDATEDTKVTSAHLEKVKILKNEKSIFGKKRLKNAGRKGKDNLTNTIKDINSAANIEVELNGEKAREVMLAKLPLRLRERLTHTKKPDHDQKIQRTPEIFRKNARNRKYLRKHKMEEFGLPENEEFVSADIAFRNLEYIPQKPEETDSVEKSFDRSFQQRMTEKKQKSKNLQPINKESIESSENEELIAKENENLIKTNLLSRLKSLKENLQAKRLVFHDTEVEIEPEEIAFEKFVYEELPEESRESTRIDITNMSFGDVFGEENIAHPNILPTPLPLRELEKTEILFESEMQLDDMFGDDDIAEPTAVFKEVQEERFERHIGNTRPMQGSYRAVKRVISLPGEKPLIQTFVEQTGDNQLFDNSLGSYITPSENESMLNVILAEKLKTGKLLEKPGSRSYGSWSKRFLNDLEKLDQGYEIEQDEDNEDKSYFSEYDMDTDIFDERQLFGGIPSPILREQAQKQTKKLENIKTKYKEAISRNKRDIEKDLFETWNFTSFPNTMEISDDLIEEHDTPQSQGHGLERQIDENLFYGNKSYDDHSISRPYIFNDTEFINRRMEVYHLLPPDESFISIMNESEMNYSDVFGEILPEESIPVRDFPRNQLKETQENFPSSNVESSSSNDRAEKKLHNILEKMRKIKENSMRNVSQTEGHISTSPVINLENAEERLNNILKQVKKIKEDNVRNVPLPRANEIPNMEIGNESFPKEFFEEERMIHFEKMQKRMRRERARNRKEIVPVRVDSPTPRTPNYMRDRMNLLMDQLEDSFVTDESETSSIQFENKQQDEIISNEPLDPEIQNLVSESRIATKNYENFLNRYKPLKKTNIEQDVDTVVPNSSPVQQNIERRGSEIQDINDLFDITEYQNQIPAENQPVPEANFISKEIIYPQNMLQQPSSPKKDQTNVLNRLPLHMQPPERMKLLIQQQPQEENLEDQTLPEADFIFEEEILYPQNTRTLQQSISSKRYQKNVPNMLPLNLPPHERIKLLIEQQPQVKVSTEPKRNEFSSLKFTSTVIPKTFVQEEFLDYESDPNEYTPEEIEWSLGDLAYAYFIPKKEEEKEILEAQERHNLLYPTPQSQEPYPDFLFNELPIQQHDKQIPSASPQHKKSGTRNISKPINKTARTVQRQTEPFTSTRKISQASERLPTIPGKSQNDKRSKPDIIVGRKGTTDFILKRTEESRNQISYPRKIVKHPIQKQKLQLTKSGNLLPFDQEPTIQERRQSRKVIIGTIGKDGKSIVQKSSVSTQRNFGKPNESTKQNKKYRTPNTKK